MIAKGQKQILDFICSYQFEKGFSPSLEEIKKYLGLSSVSTAHHHIKKLQKEGYLQKQYNQTRYVAAIKSIETIKIPLLGIISAGRSIESIENYNETIIITRDTIGKHGKYYALRVQGNSMIDEGIFDGDIVVIRQQSIAENGQTVVAVIDNNQATLKKLYRERDRIRLQPANPELFPIFCNNIRIIKG